jgi:hypothetical protein
MELISFRIITKVFIFVTTLYGGSVVSQSMPALAENQLVLPEKAWSIQFFWQGDSVNSKWEPHTAMLIPVKLKNCPKQFFMQFDLGSPYSLLYKDKLDAIESKYPKAIQLNVSTDKLVNFSFVIGKMPVLAKEIVVKQFESSTINWSNKSVEIIGTLGADLIDNNIVVIDYPDEKLIISKSISAKLLTHLELNDFIYAGRRVLLPANIQGKPTVLYFDTGSSMFELLTTKKICESLSIPNGEIIQSKVKSWDKYLIANSLASNDSIQISDTKIPIHYATYIEGVSSSQIEQMTKMGIGGMTGNKLFLDYKLILDTKSKKFGIIRSR